MVAFGDEAEYYRDLEIAQIQREARRAQLRHIDSLSPWLSLDELELLRDVVNNPPTTTPTSNPQGLMELAMGVMMMVLPIMGLIATLWS